MIEIQIEDRQAVASLGVELARLVRISRGGWYHTHTGRPSLRGRPTRRAAPRGASRDVVEAVLRAEAQIVADVRLERARFDLAVAERMEWTHCLPRLREQVAAAGRVMDEVHS